MNATNDIKIEVLDIEILKVLKKKPTEVLAKDLSEELKVDYIVLMSAINDLIEYSQRCDLVSLEKGRMRLRYGKDKVAELLHCDGKSFLIEGNNVKILTDRIKNSNIKAILNFLLKNNIIFFNIQ